MKKLLILVTMITASAFALERKDIIPFAEKAAMEKGNTYLESRNKIAGYGTDALSILGTIVLDEFLPWQQRLVARICYERIEREKDIEYLLVKDWHARPKFDKEWWQLLPGPELKMRDMVVADLKEAGLWYYYLELEWKITNEKAKIRDTKIIDFWTGWCSFAVKDNLEERVWFLRVYSDVAENPETYSRAERLYSILKQEKQADSFDLASELAEAYKREPPFRLGTKIIQPVKQP
jgi:hypothetical protein